MGEPIRSRETVYKELFGEPKSISHELDLRNPHIDVYTFPPGFGGRPCYTLATGGMSDLAMRGPNHQHSLRAELILYVDEPKPVYIHLLRYLAHIPHDQKTWFSHGSTMTNGVPPESLFENSTLDSILFLHSIVSPDAQLGDNYSIEEQPVDFLWVVSISTAERQFVIECGVDALMDVFEQRQHPVILDEQRASYI